MTVARLQKACDLVEASNPGYDQGNRWSFFDRKTLKLKSRGELDCSSGCGAIAALAGYPVNLTDPFYSGNFVERMISTGLFKAIRFTTVGKVKPGDFLVGPGHVVFVRDQKRWWSAESDERGKASGGKAGDQTGRETRFRAPYGRARGWSTIVRLISPKVFLRQAIDAYANGSAQARTLQLLRTRAPWDGPRWTWMFDQWRAIDRGVRLKFDPYTVRAGERHAFVVLGSALASSGRPSAKFEARLQLAYDALTACPTATVLITGGAPKAGITEAAAGRAWLTAVGIDPARILTEDKSASTVGNARNSVPVLRKAGITSYTLVSHASHLRRAAVLFLAARVAIETAENRKLDLEPAELLAIDDYTPKPIKPTLPVDAATRRTVAGEVKSLLGL